jgi:hypothetical protein
MGSEPLHFVDLCNKKTGKPYKIVIMSTFNSWLRKRDKI